MAPYSGAMLPIVARFGERQASPARPKNSTRHAGTTPRFRSCWSDGASTRVVAVAPSGKLALEADSRPRCGISIVHRLAEHRRPRPRCRPRPSRGRSRPLIIVVWESVPTRVSGIGDQSSPPTSPFHRPPAPGTRGSPDGRCRCPGGRRGSCLNAVLPPAQEGVALAGCVRIPSSALIRKAAADAVLVDLHRVIDQPARPAASGLIFFGSPPMATIASERIAARSTTAGHAGEILEQHAGRREGDLPRRQGVRVPAGERRDLVRGHHRAVLAAQRGFSSRMRRA